MQDNDKKNTIRIDNEEISSGFSSKDTLKINSDTIRADRSNQTLKSADQQIISSGISNKLKIRKNDPIEYKFNDVDYKLLSKITDSSTEAEIYLIEKNGSKLVLKFYYPFVKPKLGIVKRLRKIDHPDILRIIDFGFFEDRFFEILPYADQGSLSDAKPIKDLTRIKKIIKEVIEAINFCHTNGIIHRDIKPSNIFIKDIESQDILVGDFGIASLIDEGEELRRTSIFQTPIYAAPEFKVSLRGETYITKAVDYYALGITIWELWSGQLPPGSMDDLEFLRLMFEGNPPLPNDMDKNLKNLIRGLSTRNYKKRWGFKEVLKWLNGEQVFVYEENYDEEYIKKFEFGEDSNGEKVFASTPQELASLIYKYPNEGRKLLYRGLISDWLKRSNKRKLFLEIADVVEYHFKDNENAGTLYSVYLLDKNFPYYSVENKKLRTKKELIKEIENHFVIYCERLQNPFDKFYLYLLSKKADKDVETFRLLFEREDKETALYKVIYSLKLSIESRVKLDLELETKKISVDNLKILSKQLLKNPRFSDNLLKNKKFLIWLDLTDNAIYQEYQKTIPSLSKKDAAAILPYLLSPNMGYIGIDGKECQSLPEFGEEFTNNFEEYITILKDSSSPIFHYFKYHRMTGEAEFFNQAFDMNKASSKPGIYNDKIALFKIIKGAGYHKWIEVDGIILNSPDDLINLDENKAEIIRENLEDTNSYLFAWLSVFFHEFPLNEEENFYIYYLEDYEDRLKNFIEFIRNIDAGNKFVKRYDKANDKVSKIRNKFSNLRKRMKFEVITAYLLPVVLAISLFTFTLVYEDINLPLNIFSLGDWYFLVFALGFTLFYFWSSYNDSDFSFTTGCIGGPIIGLIISVVAYYIFYFILFTPLLLAAVLGIGYFYIFKQVKNASIAFYDSGKVYKDSLNLTKMENVIFAYTFGKIDGVEIDHSNELSALRSTLKENRFGIWIFSIIFSALVLLILTLLIFNTPSIL